MKKKIKAGPFIYDVHFHYQNEENCGETAPHEKNMWINTRFSIQVQRETLMHEILHICLEDFPFASEYASKQDKEDHEEALVRKISPNIVQIMKDNKWVRDFIYGK